MRLENDALNPRTQGEENQENGKATQFNILGGSAKMLSGSIYSSNACLIRKFLRLAVMGPFGFVRMINENT